MYILNFIRGFCMALADSVPGVSGGTIAFILGFYDEFVPVSGNGFCFIKRKMRCGGGNGLTPAFEGRFVFVCIAGRAA